ncbi:unnamed protein product, partial [Symbiodinium sp. KB8]
VSEPRLWPLSVQNGVVKFLFGYVQKHANDFEMRSRYKIVSAAGFQLFDSTHREPFDAPDILAALERALEDTEEKDFSSVFARELEELCSGDSGGGISREAPWFSTVEEIDEPVDASGSSKDASADLPQGKMADPPDKDASNVPMETRRTRNLFTGRGIWALLRERYRMTKMCTWRMLEKSKRRTTTWRREAHHRVRHVCQILLPQVMPPAMKFFTIRASGKAEGCRRSQTFTENFKAASSAEAKIEKAFETFEGTKEKFKAVWRDHDKVERPSPRMRLEDQKYGYGQTGTGLYHYGVGVDNMGAFQEELMQSMCGMEPIYTRRPGRMDVVLRSGGVRSTLDDHQTANASEARGSALEVHEALLTRVSELSQAKRPATREELNAMLRHYCLAAGVDAAEIGDLSLDKMPNPTLHLFGLAEDGPVPIYTSKTKYSALILNLRNFVRGRNCSAPSIYADHIDYDDSGASMGVLIKSIAQAKAHIFMLCEAGAISDSELKFQRTVAWKPCAVLEETFSLVAGPILWGPR